ncbi:MAG: hypothetical protein IPI84_09520 [Holophagaceae bacterium]|nr:hypothetical protein [Holophagaceae bacterium]
MTTAPDPHGTTRAPRPRMVRLGAGFLVLNLFVVVMAAVSVRTSLRNHQERAIATAQNLSLVLDHYVADTLGKADLAVSAVKDEVERRLADPKANAQDLDAFIQRQHARVPSLLALRTANAEGVIDHGSGQEAKTRVSSADREHFIKLRDDPGAGVVVSKPLVGRLTGSWVVIVARRLEHPDHRFAGMAIGVIALGDLQRAFSALDVGSRGSVALRDLDLGLVARYPEPVPAGTAVGSQVVSREFRAFAQSGRQAGIYRALTPFDQVQRTFSVRRVQGWPYYLVVGLAEQDYLRGWWREVYREFGGAALFLCLTLVVFLLLRRTWLRQRAAHEHLERLLAEVKTLGGMLPICSHCKKIRDDKGYWNQLEAYLNEHTEAEFTHGICPDCAKEVFPRSSGKHTTL